MITMLMKVEDAVRAISNVDDYAGSAKALAATTLRFSLSSWLWWLWWLWWFSFSIVDGDDVVKMFLKNDLEEMFWEREPWEKSLQIGRRLLPRCRFYQNCSFYQDDHFFFQDDLFLSGWSWWWCRWWCCWWWGPEKKKGSQLLTIIANPSPECFF